MALEDQKQSKRSQVCVPTEIVLEIFFRLPAESLLRCKCVCKLWFSLISDPYFINHHAKNNESAQHHRRRLVLTTRVERIIKTWNLCDVLHDEAVNALEIDLPFKDEVKFVSVVGSCNGLICLRFWDDHINTYCIWNPSTRRSSKRFSPCDKRRLVYGFAFGYDESTDDYKVVELSCLLKNETGADTLTAYIYSLKSGIWKNLSPFSEKYRIHYHPTFLNGALHWLAEKLQPDHGQNLHCIVSFDLATECYGNVSTPPDYNDKSDTFLKLGVFGEWLCVVRSYPGNYAELWVMKEYGVIHSWTQLFSIPYPIDMKSELDVFTTPLCILDEGKILLQLGSTLVVYDSKNNSSSKIQSFDIWGNATTFVESLVSPDSQ